MSELPIEPLLPEIAATLRRARRLILGAPPGAGKTTRVPLALAGLLDGFDAFPGKIIMLEPRRIAARMAAQRMAQTTHEVLCPASKEAGRRVQCTACKLCKGSSKAKSIAIVEH